MRSNIIDLAKKKEQQNSPVKDEAKSARSENESE